LSQDGGKRRSLETRVNKNHRGKKIGEKPRLRKASVEWSMKKPGQKSEKKELGRLFGGWQDMGKGPRGGKKKPEKTLYAKKTFRAPEQKR